jgi:fatty acid desaturase
MHEAAHRTLFRQRSLDDWVGNWFVAHRSGPRSRRTVPTTWCITAAPAPTRIPISDWRRAIPITRSSFKRKVWRDLQRADRMETGPRGLPRRDVGWSRSRNQRSLGMNEAEQPDVGWHKLIPVASDQSFLLAVLALAGHAELYLLWVVAWLTTYRLVTRLRSIAEHGMVPDRHDPLRNTRTTIARWWERLLLAPNRVNFHLEHHLLMTVPHHNLPRLHQLLRARGAIDEACVTPGYLAVVRLATALPE